MGPRSVITGCPGKQGQPFGRLCTHSFHNPEYDGYGMER